MTQATRRRYLGGAGAVLGGVLAAACGEPEVRYVERVVEKPVIQEKVVTVEVPVIQERLQTVTVEKPVIVEKVITVEKPVIVEKIVEVEKQVIVEKIVEKPVIVEKIVEKRVEVPAKITDPVTIEYWTPWPAEISVGKAVIDLVDQFNQAQERVQVNTLVGKEGNSRTLLPDYLAGSAPHAALLGSTGGASFMGTEVYMPLTRWLKTDKDMAKAVRDDFWPGLNEGFMWKGELYYFLWDALPVVTFLNQSYFRAAGAAAPQAGWTWQDMEELLVALKPHITDENSAPMFLDIRDTGSALPALVGQAGGEYLVSKDYRRITIGDPPVVEAAEWGRDLEKRGLSMKPGPRGSDNRNWSAGKVAIEIEGIGRLPGYRDAITKGDSPIKDEDMGWGPSLTHKRRATLVTGIVNGIVRNRDEAKMDGAYELLSWLMKPENLVAHNQINRWMPSRKSAANLGREQNVFTDPVQLGSFDDMEHGIVTMPMTPMTEAIRKRLAAALVAIDAGEPAQETLQAAAAELQLDFERKVLLQLQR